MRSVSLFLPPGLRSSVSRSPHGSEQQADAPPQEHTHASVWIATSFRPRPRMHKHANVWWSMQLHELCALHTDSLFPAALAAVLSSCARPSNRRCSAARRGGTAPGRHGHQTTPCRKPWRARVCRSTSRPAHPITELPPILSLNLDMSACLWRARKGMRSGPAPSSLPRGAVAGVAAAPAPPGVCATGRGVAAPPLLLVANIVLFRVQGCEEGLEIRAGGI